MKVKELIEALQELPQNAEVYYLTDGLNEITEAHQTVPGSDEMKEITGERFVYLK